MKLEKIFLVSILILAIVTIGAVSASEDISDDTITAIEPTDEIVSESVEQETTDEIVSESVEQEATDDGLNQAVGDGSSEETISDSVDKEDSTLELSQTVDETLAQENINSNEQLTATPNDIEIGFNDINGYTNAITTISSSGNRNGTFYVYLNGVKKLNYKITNGFLEKSVELSEYEEKFKSVVLVYPSDLNIKKSGTYSIKVSFKGDDYPTETTMAISSVSMLFCEINSQYEYMSTTETAPLTIDFPGVKSGTVKVYLVHYQEQNITYSKLLGSSKIVNGTASVKLSGLNTDYNSLLIKYSTNLGDGNMSYGILVRPNSKNVTVSVSPAVLYVGSKPVVKLTAKEPGWLRIFVDGKEKDFSDVSTKKYVISNLTAGKHTVKVVFIRYGSFYSKRFTITVKKLATKIIAKKKTFKVKTKVKKYTITLKSGKKLVKKVKVTLRVGKKTYKAKTNNKGKATFKITKLKKRGKYTATIKFVGTKKYKATRKKVKITVKK